ncbi:hypothetical protein Glove_420g59 [Diversispora epigaea]|uniref:Uncharacterized protein n=1 Tax=Diversispora epigaea TaxID=1348612 RepID=A0A397GZT7_9GLOM|nr:hypothetical protein Glove_420g59 [Diversispora epigaea]
MQRGLRVISTSVELWKEYFKLELSYVSKIKARLAIISLGPIKGKKEEVETEPNNMDDSMIEENNNYSQSDNEIIPIIIDEENCVLKCYKDDLSFRLNLLIFVINTLIRFQSLIIFIKDFRNYIEARSFFVERHIFDLDVNSLEYIAAIKKTVEEYRESLKKTLLNYFARLLSKTYSRAFHTNMVSSQIHASGLTEF